MKPSEFYADYQSTTVGVTGLTFTEKWTQPAMSIYVQSQNNFSTEAYYLGWIRYDNLPIIMGHHSVTVDAENDSLVFEDNTVVDNYPCGYLRQNNNYNAQIFVEDGVVISGIGGYTPSMHNDLHPEYSALNGAALRFKYYEKINDEIVPRQSIITDINGANISFGYHQPNTLQELFDFLNGTSTFTYTVGNYTYDLDASQLTEGYGEFVSNEDESRSILIFLSTIKPYVPRYSRAASSGDFSSAFFATVKYEDSSQEEHSYDVVLADDNNSSLGLGIYYWNTSNFTVDSNIKYSGKVSGEFKISDLTSMSATTGYAISGNIFCYCRYGSGGTNPRTNFSILSNPADMLRTLSLYYRVDFSGTNPPTATYVKDVTYATNVTSDDEFLAELKTGNISDDTFRNGLRYWQYSSIASNDFDEEDVPPYEPPEPPDEGEESGDPINIQIRAVRGATNFITQYAMTPTQVAVFGNKLWTSWVDGQGDLTDFFQNFWLVATGQTDTGSMDIGAMMQFIVSLQVFPFVIPELFGTQVNEIKVGRGVLPIDMQTAPNVLRLTTSNIYLGCGSRKIPRPYGDYRDYTNITITAYLPFVGTCELNAADVIGRTLTCHYFIDLYTGGCTAYMMAFDDEGHNYPVCQMDGSIGATLPVSATNSAQIKTQTISNAMGLASTLAGSYSQHINAGKQAIAGLVSGNGEALAMAAESQFSSKMSALQGIGNFAENVLTQAGVGCPSLAGGKGDLSSFSQPAYPYIQMRYGLYDEPSNYNHSVGVPSTKSGTLSGYTGFVVCENVDVSSLTCHTDEKAAIKAALESGVYV